MNVVALRWLLGSFVVGSFSAAVLGGAIVAAVALHEIERMRR